MKAEQVWIGGETYYLRFFYLRISKLQYCSLILFYSGRGIIPEGNLCKDKEYKVYII